MSDDDGTAALLRVLLILGLGAFMVLILELVLVSSLEQIEAPAPAQPLQLKEHGQLDRGGGPGKSSAQIRWHSR